MLIFIFFNPFYVFLFWYHGYSQIKKS
jgi:hypothetical protein